MRKLAAFVIAPLVPALVVSVIMVLLGEEAEARTAILTSVFVGYPIAIAVGLPLDHFVFSQQENRTFRVVLIWTSLFTVALIVVFISPGIFTPSGGQLAISLAFWVYVLLFWMAFVAAVWSFIWISYG